MLTHLINYDKTDFTDNLGILKKPMSVGIKRKDKKIIVYEGSNCSTCYL